MTFDARQTSRHDLFPGIAASRRLVLAMALGAGAASLIPKARAQGATKGIGIVGSGKIGGLIGTLWAAAGHPVLFSSRHPDTLKDLVTAAGPNARVGTPAEALAFGEAVLLAIPYNAYPDFGRANVQALAGRIVLDAGNTVRQRDGALDDEAKANGIGATSRKYLPGARIVRAFNSLPAHVFKENAHKNPPIALPIAADDPEALRIAVALVHDAGFDAVVTGGLDTAIKFQMGTGSKGFGLAVPAPDLRRILEV